MQSILCKHNRRMWFQNTHLFSVTHDIGFDGIIDQAWRPLVGMVFDIEKITNNYKDSSLEIVHIEVG